MRDSGLQIGFQRWTITPPIGLDMSGYGGREGPAVGVRDDLFLDAVAFRSADAGLLWLNADILAWADEHVAYVRERIVSDIGLPPETVALCATHTHSGPAVARLRDLGDPETNYVSVLQRRAVSAAALAWQNAVPVQLAIGKSRCDSIIKNRRQPDGPVDPEVLVLRWMEEKPGAVVGFTCHPVVLTNQNRCFSADYCGVARGTMEDVLDHRSPVMFSNGCAGDINPMQQGEQYLTTYGRLLAFAALVAFEQAQPLAASPLSAARAVVELPCVEPPSVKECKQEVVALERELSDPHLKHDKISTRTYLQWARDRLQQVQSGTYRQSHPAEVQVFRIGDLALVFLPGEPLVRLGLQIKEDSPAPFTWVAGYANATVGYVTDAQSWTSGGYEAVHAARYYMMGPYQQKAGPLLVHTALALLCKVF